jgi:hypothetical protein
MSQRITISHDGTQIIVRVFTDRGNLLLDLSCENAAKLAKVLTEIKPGERRVLEKRTEQGAEA